MLGGDVVLVLELVVYMVKAHGAMAVCIIRVAVDPIWAFGSMWWDLKFGIIGGMKGMFVLRDREEERGRLRTGHGKGMEDGCKDEFYYGKYLPQSISRRFLKDTLVLVRTDIVDSTSLWNDFPSAMYRTIETHDEIARRLCKMHKGLEVRNEGDSFFLVFTGVRNALDFSVEFYREVKRISFRFEGDEDREGSLPLKVRIAMDSGPVVLRQDEFLGVYGDVVSRTLELLAHSNGRICISRSCLQTGVGWADDRPLFCIHK